MKIRKLHKYLGLLMVLPFIAWAVTGTFFFIKPGYDKAYEQLKVRTYPQSFTTATSPEQFEEIRWLTTVLGQHLIVKKEGKWQQRHPSDFSELLKPSEQQVKALVEDAIKGKARYGNIATVDGTSVTTDTGVKISLNWQKMTLYQRGEDTDFIEQMYKIHYLQWTGNKTIDKYLGIIGLSIVVLLAIFGFKMAFAKKRPTNRF